MAEAKVMAGGIKPEVTPNKKKRLLVVDDDLTDLLRYSAILQNEGYEVRSIASHQEAARCVSREKFDLIIVSQGTADFEGRSVIAQTFARSRKVPVVVLSRSSDIDCYLEAMQMGAVDYREKPVPAPELAAIVGRHLGHPKARIA